MPSHKETNAFIRKYNNLFQIKGYSKMNIQEKNKAVENKLRALNSDNVKEIRAEWSKLKGSPKTTLLPPSKKKQESTKKSSSTLGKSKDKLVLVPKSEYKLSDITAQRSSVLTDKQSIERFSTFKKENKPIVVYKEHITGDKLMKDYDKYYITSKNAWENRSGEPKPNIQVDFKEKYGLRR